MIKFFCAVCVEDMDLHPEEMCMTCCSATCPNCGTKLRSLYARPENPNEEDLGIDAYCSYHEVPVPSQGLDNPGQ